MERSTVELAQDILAVRGIQHPAAFCLFSVESQLEKIRAFEKAINPALKVPRLEILRRVEGDLALAFDFVIHGHHPRLRRFMPDEFRIAAGVFHDGISVEFGPRPAAVIAEDDALAPAGAGKGSDEHVAGTGLEAR